MPAASTPNTSQQSIAEIALTTKRCATTAAMPQTIRLNATANPQISREDETPNFATGAQRPSAMPQQNAAAMATAGNFTECASSAPASRCEKFAGTDQTDGLPRFRNDSHLRSP